MTIEQLKYVAQNLCINMFQFCKRYGIPYQSLAHYMDGTRGSKKGISVKNQEKIRHGLKDLGVEIDKVINGKSE